MADDERARWTTRCKAAATMIRKGCGDDEERFWSALMTRDGRRFFGGHRWFRQVPLGPYIADFFCPSLDLVVEIDGQSHYGSGWYRDRERGAFLEDAVIVTLRFWNSATRTAVLGDTLAGLLAVMRSREKTVRRS